MSELITVDFKTRAVTKRVDLENPVPAWSAAKDPSFKAYVEGMAHLAELVHKNGGNWRRMIITLQPDASDYETCYTVWDQETITAEQVSDSLMLSANKVDMTVQEAQPDATT